MQKWLRLSSSQSNTGSDLVRDPLPGCYDSHPWVNQAEQAELRGFLNKYQAPKPVTELNDKYPGQPFVQVKVPRLRAAGNPIIFEIRIEHR